ncbi:hypothetical protein HN51_046727 [Arachis hypogaea]
MSLAVISSTNQQTSSSSTNRNSTHQTQLKPPPFVARLSFIVEAVLSVQSLLLRKEKVKEEESVELVHKMKIFGINLVVLLILYSSIS